MSLPFPKLQFASGALAPPLRPFPSSDVDTAADTDGSDDGEASWEAEPSTHVTLGTSAIRVVLEAVPGAAFVLEREGETFAVLHANAGGRRLLRTGLDVRELLEAAIVDTETNVSIRPFAVPGRGRHLLLIVGSRAESVAPDGDLRLARTMSSWTLTRRQADVLSLVVHGHSNKVIAERLRCAIRTVEVHVSSLLTKGGVESRAALVALFWTFSLDDQTQPLSAAAARVLASHAEESTNVDDASEPSLDDLDAPRGNDESGARPIFR